MRSLRSEACSLALQLHGVHSLHGEMAHVKTPSQGRRVLTQAGWETTGGEVTDSAVLARAAETAHVCAKMSIDD